MYMEPCREDTRTLPASLPETTLPSPTSPGDQAINEMSPASCWPLVFRKMNEQTRGGDTGVAPAQNKGKHKQGGSVSHFPAMQPLLSAGARARQNAC